MTGKGQAEKWWAKAKGSSKFSNLGNAARDEVDKLGALVKGLPVADLKALKPEVLAKTTAARDLSGAQIAKLTGAAAKMGKDAKAFFDGVDKDALKAGVEDAARGSWRGLGKGGATALFARLRDGGAGDAKYATAAGFTKDSVKSLGPSVVGAAVASGDIDMKDIKDEVWADAADDSYT